MMPRERNTLLSQARQQRGWSQAEVARRLAVDPAYVRRWEHGLVRPSPVYRERLCELFRMTADQLGLLTEAQASVVQREEEGPRAEQQIRVLDPLLPLFGSSSPPLVGRASLLEQLKAHLCAGSSVVLTALHGLPGVGKTTLALTLVTDVEVQVSFPDGILWAGLGPAPDVVTCLARWGSLLGLGSEDLPDRSAHAWALALRVAIGQRRMLLVLDDAWRAEDVMALRVGGPHCAYVVTTRSPMLSFLTGSAPTIAVPELSEEDALTLLARFVPNLVAQEPQTALELVRLVGGLPLALTLIGGYLAMQTATGQPRRLHAALTRIRDTEQRLQVSKPLPLLERSPRLLSSNSVSLQASIALSIEHLPQPARGALSRLAVFAAKPNSFSEEAALAVAASSLEDLDTLTDAGLLEVSGPDRYTLHQTITDYARAHCPKQEGEEAKRRLVSYWLEFAKKHVSDYDTLAQESQNLLTALEAAWELGLARELAQGVIAFAPFLLLRGQYALAEGYLRYAWQLAQAGVDPSTHVELLRLLGESTEGQGDYLQAEGYYQQGLQIAQQWGQRGQAISALLERLGAVARERGHYTQAEWYFQQGLQVARQGQETTRICSIFGHLSWVDTERGNYSQAESYAHEALSLARQQGRRDLMGQPLRNLGMLAAKQDNFAQAEQYKQEALALARQLGETAMISQLLNNLGWQAIEQGDYAQAEIYLQEGLTLARQIGHRALVGLLSLNLGRMVGRQGDYPRACTYLQEGIELARAITSQWLLSVVLNGWGEIHLTFGHLDEAANVFREALFLNQGQEGIVEMLGDAQYGLARVAALRGEHTEAQRLAQDSLVLFETIGNSTANEVKRWLHTLEAPAQDQNG